MAGLIQAVWQPKQPTGFANGTVSVGTTSMSFPNVPVALGHFLVISAPTSNTRSVFISGGSATTNDTELAPGSGIMIAIDNANRLACISTHTGQRLKYMVETG